MHTVHVGYSIVQYVRTVSDWLLLLFREVILKGELMPTHVPHPPPPPHDPWGGGVGGGEGGGNLASIPLERTFRLSVCRRLSYQKTGGGIGNDDRIGNITCQPQLRN
jgi:hypothetical protein